jgi:WD40 repeat protein
MFIKLLSLLRCVWVAALFSLAITAARGEDTPILMLDTGGHAALVKGLQFSHSGKYLISAGEDKVIRIWDWEKERTE